jgi:hypothetical protein
MSRRPHTTPLRTGADRRGDRVRATIRGAGTQTTARGGAAGARVGS